MFKSSAVTTLSVPVTDSLALDAGTCVGSAAAVTILPPSVSMLDQLLDWLSRQAPPDSKELKSASMGIGATALCLRWGTYLTVLLDDRKPVDPRAASPGISMISDSEMKRINLEFAANLARLVRMLHEDESHCRGLLHLACEYLAMPRLRPARCDELLSPLLELTSPRFWSSAGPDLRARMERIQPVVIRHPYRVLANSMALAAWRNGPVEDIHAGLGSDYSLDHRRASDRQIQEVMRFTSERLAAVLGSFRPWERGAGSVFAWPGNLAGIYISPRFTSRIWSLTESSSRIDLESPPDSLSRTR